MASSKAGLGTVIGENLKPLTSDLKHWLRFRISELYIGISYMHAGMLNSRRLQFGSIYLKMYTFEAYRNYLATQFQSVLCCTLIRRWLAHYPEPPNLTTQQARKILRLMNSKQNTTPRPNQCKFQARARPRDLDYLWVGPYCYNHGDKWIWSIVTEPDRSSTLDMVKCGLHHVELNITEWTNHFRSQLTRPHCHENSHGLVVAIFGV